MYSCMYDTGIGLLYLVQTFACMLACVYMYACILVCNQTLLISPTLYTRAPITYRKLSTNLPHTRAPPKHIRILGIHLIRAFRAGILEQFRLNPGSENLVR